MLEPHNNDRFLCRCCPFANSDEKKKKKKKNDGGRNEYGYHDYNDNDYDDDDNDDYSCCWKLQTPPSSLATTTTLCRLGPLEDWLQEGIRIGLDTKNDDDNNNDNNNNNNNTTTTIAMDTPAIDYKMRADVIWTRAQRPYRRPWETILGLAEYHPPNDDEDDDESPPPQAWRNGPCRITCREIVVVPANKEHNDNDDDDNDNNNKSRHSHACSCPFPQPPWQKQSTRSKRNNTGNNKDNNYDDDDDDDKDVFNQHFPPKEHVMEWIDGSAIGDTENDRHHHHHDDKDGASFSLPTRRSAMHFLRCLLGVDQTASPWWTTTTHDNSDDNSNNNNNNNYPTAAVRTVILAVPRQQATPDAPLVQLRVSDACPSWLLHAIVPAFPHAIPARGGGAVPNNNNDDDTLPFLQLPRETRNTMSLLIYQRLPPRNCLQRLHPVTQQPSPVKDCLWETNVPKKGNDDNNDNNDDDDDMDDEPVHRLVAPPYVNAAEYYPNVVRILHDNLSVLQQEAKHIAHWTAWPEQQHYQAVSDDDDDDNNDDDNNDNGAPWNVFPLCYCFPANDVTQRQWIPLTTAAVPHTTRILHSLGPVLRTALFSRLDAGTRLEAHTGWQDLANHVVRLHVPLDIPHGHLCGTWVDGCVMTHTPPSNSSGDGDDPKDCPWICFDDSKTHWAWNYSTRTRTVLILDLERPPGWPKGTATGGHSEELDNFIQQMSTPR